VEESFDVTAKSVKPPRFRARKMQALIAGGLVLGVGAAVTLAAWNDSEFAQGTFAAGTFNMLGSVDGTTYTDHATVGSPATLAFTVNPTSLSPSDVIYAPFAVELGPNTTNDATVMISSATSHIWWARFCTGGIHIFFCSYSH
jgi:predicted ribosomally synthesized peptide with SipW-like signal peptide